MDLKFRYMAAGLVLAMAAGGCSMPVSQQPPSLIGPAVAQVPATYSRAGLTRTTTLTTSLPVREAAAAAGQVLADMRFDVMSANGDRVQTFGGNLAFDSIGGGFSFSIDYFSGAIGFVDVQGERMLLECKWVKEGLTEVRFSSELSEDKQDLLVGKIGAALKAGEKKKGE